MRGTTSLTVWRTCSARHLYLLVKEIHSMLNLYTWVQKKKNTQEKLCSCWNLSSNHHVSIGQVSWKFQPKKKEQHMQYIVNMPSPLLHRRRHRCDHRRSHLRRRWRADAKGDVNLPCGPCTWKLKPWSSRCFPTWPLTLQSCYPLWRNRTMRESNLSKPVLSEHFRFVYSDINLIL